MFRGSCTSVMTPSRSPALPNDEPRADTIPAPPPSAARIERDEGDSAPESRIASRRRDTIPAPAPVPSMDDDAPFDAPFDDGPPTDRAPVLVRQLDAV